jgi:murein DD-endopeptidase MepM/ murein hydrolase activator NlpD
MSRNMLIRGSAVILLSGFVALYAGLSGGMPWAAAIAPPAKTTAVAKPVSMPPPRTELVLDRAASQGSLIKGRIPDGATGIRLNGVNVPVASDGYFLIGFDRDAPKAAKLEILMANGRNITRDMVVAPGVWKIERTNANPTGGAATTAEYLARRGAETARINAARNVNAKSDGWRQKLVWPVKGRISGVFGSQRIYKGFPGSFHSGLDVAAPIVKGKKIPIEGKTYVAPADGVVILAAQEEFTLEGHLLMIDHGMGMISAFLHGQKLLVKEGDIVKQGQPLGLVGMTGRASGPHLHWSIRWNDAKVDPLPLLPPM